MGHFQLWDWIVVMLIVGLMVHLQRALRDRNPGTNAFQSKRIPNREKALPIAILVVAVIVLELVSRLTRS